MSFRPTPIYNGMSLSGSALGNVVSAAGQIFQGLVSPSDRDNLPYMVLGQPIRDSLPNVLSGFYNFVNDHNNSGSLSSDKEVISSPSSGVGVASAPVTPAVIDYLNADLAKHYGLGKETAYQEALSNTSYQRAVADMKAAGLNPAAIFGAGKGYTAGGVSYVNGASGSGRSGGSGSSQNGYLFDEGMYHAISTAAGLAGLAITKQPIGFYIAQTAAQGVMGAMNHFSK